MMKQNSTLISPFVVEKISFPVLQSYCRRYLAQLHYKKLKKAAITTQSAWRGRVARKELRKLKMVRSPCFFLVSLFLSFPKGKGTAEYLVIILSYNCYGLSKNVLSPIRLLVFLLLANWIFVISLAVLSELKLMANQWAMKRTLCWEPHWFFSGRGSSIIRFSVLSSEVIGLPFLPENTTRFIVLRVQN